MATLQHSDMITAFKGKTRVCFDFIHSYYTNIDEIWLPAPYNLTVNLASGLTSMSSVHVFSTDEARFDQASEIKISRALADQYLRYVTDKAELEKVTTDLLCLKNDSSKSESQDELVDVYGIN
jgi:hypothetical protein